MHPRYEIFTMSTSRNPISPPIIEDASKKEIVLEQITLYENHELFSNIFYIINIYDMVVVL